MDYLKLINELGFDIDPFAKTNADEEELLGEYFIEPPFYNAVYGDINNPKSAVVFAPRGGGKTALKRKLEIASQDDSFLCISYNSFNVVGMRIEDINLEYHLENVIRLILVGVLSRLESLGLNTYSKDERHIIYLFINKYFSEIDKTILKEAINSVKNLKDKAKEWWNNFTGPVGVILNALLTKIGFNNVELEKFRKDKGSLGDLTDQLETLYLLSYKAGYKSIYVLIDKVDENNLTGNKASNSYQFIKPMISNLQVLELKGFGFKFFLWDAIKEDYQNDARPDRVKYYNLHWDREQLKIMLSRRLNAYSQGKVNNYMQLCTKDVIENIDEIIAVFCQMSPRNVVRICKEIIDQQSEIDSIVSQISMEAIIRGFEVFAENYTNEILQDKVIRELKKIKKVSFTSTYIYNNAFKISQQAGSSKIKGWLDSGIIEQIGTTQENNKSRAVNFYAVSNLIVAKHIFSDISIFEFINKKIRYCSHCGNILLRDWDLIDSSICINCGDMTNTNKMA